MPTSIVAIVFRAVAFVATKLKASSADEAPLIVTVPALLSLTNTLPFAALAVILATLVANGDATLIPTDPFKDVKVSALAFTTPVIWLFSRLL